MIPEKWCIRITKENQHIVGKYYNEHTSEKDCYTKSVSRGCYVASHNTGGKSIINGVNENASFYCGKSAYPEITLEQFQQLIGEPVNSLYEIY